MSSSQNILLLLVLLVSSCTKPVEFIVDRNFHREWKEESMDAIYRSCDSVDKAEHLISESRQTFHSRKEMFNTLMTTIDLDKEDTFLIWESIMPKGVVGGAYMYLETETSKYEAHFFNQVLTLNDLGKKGSGLILPTENTCCQAKLEEYKKYRGFKALRYLTVFKKADNRFVRNVFAQEP